MAINWAQALQLTSLLLAAHSSGYGLCSDRLALHNTLLLSDRDTITRQWFRAWDFGRKYGPVVVTGSGLGFLGAALLDGVDSPGFSLNLSAAVSMGLVVVYTVLYVFPVNDKLLAAHSSLISQKKSDDASQTSDEIRNLAATWKGADLKRTLLSTFAAVAGLVAAWIIASKLALGQVTKTFNSPIARTWALWSSFGAARLYIAGCDAVDLHGFGVGSVRVLSMYGNKVHETLKYIDPATHSYAYSIADSPGFPATGSLGFIQLQELTKGQTQITWRGFADRVVPGAEESLRLQLDSLYNDSIEKARKALEK